ncbi:MAG: polysaccharide deacetylase family protein [Salinivirgaceae bacterium]|nr:polysaccharide deacetylase family protein [Salinivirgaceae bacterium]MDY0279635.1 polysaccharide deacetylase family protein [Salinivirgaceae bacterium]
MINPYHLPQHLIKETIWRIKNNANNIFLTFDDGPNPSTTPYILDVLDQNDIKATFFCIGKNVERHPALFDDIILRGHAVGNHTYSHLKGWRCSNEEYINDINLAAEYIQGKLFRPPYGQMKLSQIKLLRDHYKIFFWSVLSWDFNESLSAKTCVKRVVPKTRSGDIIVFHDSSKAFERLQGALPIAIKKLQNKEFNFCLIK